MAESFLKDSTGKFWLDGTGKFIKNRPFNEALLPSGLIGIWDADYVENVGGYARTLYNIYLPEIATITVTASATSTGNIIIRTGDVEYLVSVTSGDSAATIAGKIRATVFANTTNSGSSTSAILTKNLVVLSRNTTFSANGVTGVTATVSISQGVNFEQSTVASQPLITPNFQNGHQALNFNGTKQLTPTSNITGVYTILLVLKMYSSSHYLFVGNGSDYGVGAYSSSTYLCTRYNYVAYPLYINGTKRSSTSSDLNKNFIIMNNDYRYSTVSKIYSEGGGYFYLTAIYNRYLSIEEIQYNTLAMNTKYAIY